MEETKSMTTKRILIFIGITFLITYGLEFGIIYPLSNQVATYSTSMTVGMTVMLLQITVAGMMFLPSIGVLLTRLITKEGFSDCWIKPRFRGHMRYYVMAWFLPAICTILGAVLYFVIFQKDFDGNLGYIISLYQAQGVTVDRIQAMTIALAQLAIGVFLSPILNILTCFGEEWGWRGYLLPKMKEKLPMLPMLLVNGIIWGLWHAPLTMLGHNYGLGYKGYPFTGILAMCLFCIVIGVFLTYVTLKTGSCLPAAIAHGGLNGMAAAGTLFLSSDAEISPFIGPAPTGIVGGAFFILLGIILSIVLVSNSPSAEEITDKPEDNAQL